MPIRSVQLGSPRIGAEGVRIGTVRYVPRGVPKGKWSAEDYFDVWLPVLAPSGQLMRWRKKHADEADWTTFAARYRREVEKQGRDVLLLLAALSHGSDFSVGCYCVDEARCHRSVLKELLRERGAAVV